MLNQKLLMLVSSLHDLQGIECNSGKKFLKDYAMNETQASRDLVNWWNH